MQFQDITTTFCIILQEEKRKESLFWFDFANISKWRTLCIFIDWTVSIIFLQQNLWICVYPVSQHTLDLLKLWRWLLPISSKYVWQDIVLLLCVWSCLLISQMFSKQVFFKNRSRRKDLSGLQYIFTTNRYDLSQQYLTGVD